MALISRVPAFDVATAMARALEALIGHDVILTVGPPSFGDPNVATLPEEPTRSVALPFAIGVIGEVTLVVTEHFATAMEAATPDASLATAAVPALDAAAAAIESTLDISANFDWAGEISTETLLTSVEGDFVIVPILENDERMACVVVRLVEEASLPAAPSPPAPVVAAPAVVIPAPAALAPTVIAPTAAPTAPTSDGIALHQFQPLGDGHAAASAPRSLTLLNDVNMEVTAELGRRLLKVREIMALEPGSVIELDRAAGSPVDVLVNGSIVWHGEVVVVDEEFGIRVSEIVMDDH